MRPMGPTEFIETALSEVEDPTAQPAPNPADVRAMELMANAFNGPQNLTGSETHRRIHSELARVQRRDGTITPTTATQRAQPSTIQRSGNKFKMKRDWDPNDR